MSVLESSEARGDTWLDTAFAKGDLGMLKRTHTFGEPWKQRTFCIFEHGLAYTSHKVKIFRWFDLENIRIILQFY